MLKISHQSDKTSLNVQWCCVPSLPPQRDSSKPWSWPKQEEGSSERFHYWPLQFWWGIQMSSVARSSFWASSDKCHPLLSINPISMSLHTSLSNFWSINATFLQFQQQAAFAEVKDGVRGRGHLAQHVQCPWLDTRTTWDGREAYSDCKSWPTCELWSSE
jgi:hypothetical protein